MGRVRTHIQVNGRKCWTLFDTGARNTYIVADQTTGLQVLTLPRSYPAALGRQVYPVNKECHFEASVEGFPVTIKARVVDKLGTDEQGRRIEIILGALAMQEWGINVDTKNERLDLTHYPKEFVEF